MFKKKIIFIISFIALALLFIIMPSANADQEIEDGIYEIETGVNSNKVLDVIDAVKYSGGNVQIYTKNANADCQKLIVKYIGDDYYTLSFVHSGKYLDVADGKKEDHTNVWQCNYNGSNAQKWKIIKADDGYYYMVSKCSGTYLTVKDGKTTNCTNIEICSKVENEESQKFKFNKIDNDNSTDNSNNIDIEAKKTIEDGTYEIETGVNSNKALDVINAVRYSGGNVQIYTKNDSANCQKLKVEYIGDGYYTLSFVHSGKYLDVADGKKADHTNVWQCNYNGSDAQKWIIAEAGDDYYYIVSKCSNTFLTVANGGTTNCTNIEICSKTENRAAQKFKFNKIEHTIEPKKTIEDGIYEIETGVNSNKALDVINAVKYSGGNVQIYTKNEKANCQKLSVKYLGDGYYTLSFIHSKKYLDVADGKTEDHTNVWQCNYNGSDAQKWIIAEAGDDYYYIVSKCSGTYLTVKDGKTTNCTNIEVCSGNGSSEAQKFKFNETEIAIEAKKTIADGTYEIETGVNSNKALDVINAVQYSGGNVQIYT